MESAVGGYFDELQVYQYKHCTEAVGCRWEMGMCVVKGPLDREMELFFVLVVSSWVLLGAYMSIKT